MRIFSDGNVGINTGATNAGYKLDVSGTGRFTGALSTTGGTRNIQMVSFAADWNYLRSNGANLVFGTQDANTLYIRTNDVDRLTIASSGAATFSNNIGLGVTPSAWQTSSYRVIELPNGASIHGQTDAPLIEVASNMYINSSYNYTYTTNGYSTRYRQYQGVHSWLTAPSGTAGNAISFTQAMTLGANGNLLVGTTTDSGYKLDVNGTGRFRNELYVTGANNWELQSYSDGNLYINRAGVFSALSFNGSSGAATFSSSVTATSFFESSDSRLKILVKDYEQPKGIENVAARMYVKNSKQELGYYAQDLQEILPSAVSEGEDGFLSLSYSQVHTAKIAYLEEKVAQLEELIKSLKIN